MDFVEQLQALATKIPKLCDILLTEEATKNALIMPFIGILGYDIFDPTEVIPEFTADMGTKKGEKVDYALVKDGKIIILFECKHCGSDLHINHASQLFRYFSVTDARIAVLTNGVVYRLFTDLEAPNIMDKKPFLEVNMMELNEFVVDELKKLTKPAFNIDDLMGAAGELKYTREVKRLLAEQFDSPTDEFVRFFASKIFNGPLTPTRKEYFAGITKRGLQQHVNDRISERLKSAMGDSGGILPLPIPQIAVPAVEAAIEVSAGDGKERLLETTSEEMEGFFIVKALLRDVVEPSRIVHRDTQSYFGILLDDNNRKPLARLYFNRSQKYVGFFDENRVESKIPITDLNDIYAQAATLRKVVAFYEKEGSGASAPTDAPAAISS